VLHGYNLRRIRAGMQYIAINLVASFMFRSRRADLRGDRTLNIADLSARVGPARRAGRLSALDRRSVLALAS